MNGPDTFSRKRAFGIVGWALCALATASPAAAQTASTTDISGALTNFAGMAVSGKAPPTLRIGGRIDVWASIDGRDIGLWEGLAINIKPEFVYGQSINGQGSGETLPLNTALSFPSANAEDFDMSFNLSQTIGKGRLTIGKINTVDLKTRTPLLGGGGIDGFQFLQFAAPITVFTPPSIIGALYSTPVGKTSLTVGIWDPESAINRTGFEQRLFRKGVNGMVALTVPVTIGGKSGWQSFTVSGTTKQGIDLDTVPELTLPPTNPGPFGTRRGGWLVKYGFQQYLWQDPDNPRVGWGIFGDISGWDSNPTPLARGASLGITGNPAFVGRPSDRFGMAWFRFKFAQEIENALQQLVQLEAEQGVELFYTLALSPKVALTANAQWLDPAQAKIPNSLHTGLRLTARF